MTRQIIVPEPIACINIQTKKLLQREIKPVQIKDGNVIAAAVLEDDEPWSLYRGLAVFVGQREEWQKPLDKALRLFKFLTRLDGAEVGKPIEISDELWRPLRDTLVAEDFEIPFPYNVQLPPLFQPVLDAQAPAQTLQEVSQAEA
ncbi:hypothetical protein LCGC14_1112640 [marine sediment metagenome]|uniref:Uncharacterized protein n=1 Tax=marine sediment metagenome TaxID=412755 RepID=A0A0F9M6A4_9ZZZZ